LALQVVIAVSEAGKGWFVQNATLVIGVVGILVSGLAGPSIAALLMAKREREKDARARVIAQRDDLRGVVDEAAKALGEAVARLRPALHAQLSGQPLPQETRDFLAELFTLGQRLRLRAPETDPMVTSYDAARTQLIAMSQATRSQVDFDGAAKAFAERRAVFLDKAREALEAPIPQRGRS
jgi:hypothetical protein